MKSICGFCYEPLDAGERFFHRSCSEKLFGIRNPPELPFTNEYLEELAEKTVRASITVPGVQTKLSLHLEKEGRGSGRLTVVGLWGSFILKPPVKEYPFLPEIEDMTMHLASIAGIRTVPHGLIPMFDGRLAYITRRVDRPLEKQDRKRKMTKRHMEDMCQLAERQAEYKYTGSMEQISRIIRKYSSNPGLDLTKFFDMALFSFLAGNGDMHLKNISLIYGKNSGITLAPAYDLLSTRLILPERVDPEEMALTVNGKKAKLGRGDYELFGKASGLSQKQIDNALGRMKRCAPAMLKFIEKGFLPENKSEELAGLIRSRVARLYSSTQ